FENVRRTGDVINESIRYFSQQYMDMPINQALIDALTESVNTCGGAAQRYFLALEEGINLLPGFSPELQGVYSETDADGIQRLYG
ncbi:hypothetical protein MJM99_29585, partial [Salmonella enterica subsp. enterica serovar Kentucky]|nr:hypothetical protein [Salmonella enterica subsp. enterica serovar Kentucky]